MSLENEITLLAENLGADFVHFVDVSTLPCEQNRNYPTAILVGKSLTRGYLQKITSTPDYVQRVIRGQKKMNEDEFYLTEQKTDKLADELAEKLMEKSYSSFSQSERNLRSTGNLDEERKMSPLPHKTIALMAGLGWIGKHNLLVTPEFGSAVSLCTVLTNAPVNTVSFPIAKPQCGNCDLCQQICEPKAIKGATWNVNISRDEMIDVFKCSTCLKCLAICPWTKKYMLR